MMNDPKKRLKDAKDLLDMSLIQQHEYDDIKNDVMQKLGLLSSANALPTSEETEEETIVNVLKRYKTETDTDWLKQNPKIILGYLMDMLSNTFEAGWLRMFLFLSYEDYVVKVLLKGDANALHHLLQGLSLRYNKEFLEKTVAIWQSVLGMKQAEGRFVSNEANQGDESPVVFSFLDEPTFDNDKPALQSLAFLHLNKGLVHEKSYPLSKKSVCIGRSRSMDIQIANDSSVSRFHCKIFWRRGSFFIEDQDSANGTLINGNAVTEKQLYGDEELTIGQSHFIFVLGSSCHDSTDGEESLLTEVPSNSPAKKWVGSLLRSPGLAEEKNFFLIKSTNCIGRSPDMDIQIVADSKVSRCHCKVFRKGKSFYIEDQKSVNGTTVNGEPITKRHLFDGDDIMVGQTKFRFTLSEIN